MKREELFEELWLEQDRANDLAVEYDLRPHRYGDMVLFQAEGALIHEIGKKPNITLTEIASILKRTPGACSQIVKKLANKGLIEQTRNKENRRVYNLTLTEEGNRIYIDHLEFNRNCKNLVFQNLKGYSDEELMTYIKIQKELNKSLQDYIVSNEEENK